MVSRKYFVAALLVSVSAMPVNAGETITYKYDSLGRLVQTVQSDGANDGVLTNLDYDPAGNRTEYKVEGSGDIDPDDNSTGSTDSGNSGGGGETPPSFSIADTGDEEGEIFNFRVTKNGTVTGSYSVDYTTVEATNSATENSDYDYKAGALTFDAADSFIDIPIVTNDDSVAGEGPEIFYVQLSNPSGGATLVANSDQATGTIADNDTSGNIPPEAVEDVVVMPRCATRHKSLTGNDTDQDANTPLVIEPGSVSFVSSSPAGAPAISVTPSTTHPNSHVNIVAPNVTVQTIYTYNYTVKDTLGATDVGTLTIDARAFGATC